MARLSRPIAAGIPERIEPMPVIELRISSTRYHFDWPWLSPEPGPFVWRSMSQGICWRSPGLCHLSVTASVFGQGNWK
jgi:hypothetical protein